MACRIGCASDNGPPFAIGRRHRADAAFVRFIKLGITLERIAPGKPQQNGRHERFHLTMLPLARSPGGRQNGAGQAFETFRREIQ